MAGAPKKPVNIFKLYRGDAPAEIFNWRLWLAVFSFSLMGAARGVDEGLINGVFEVDAFQRLIGVDKLASSEFADIKGNVVAMVNIGSVGGALLYVHSVTPRGTPQEDTNHSVVHHLFATVSDESGLPGCCACFGPWE